MSARDGRGVSPWRAPLLALVIDIVLVTAFAAVGRASHDSDVFAGLWQTAWPFLAGLLLGWGIVRAWRAPWAPLRTGVGVWVVTLVVGMLLRALSGQGTAIAFVIVAALTLLLLLVGVRAVVTLAARIMNRARRAPTSS